MDEIILGASHMINNNIFNIFCFSTFSFAHFLDPGFGVGFFKFCQIQIQYQKEEVEKQKNVKNVIIHHMWDP